MWLEMKTPIRITVHKDITLLGVFRGFQVFDQYGQELLVSGNIYVAIIT